MRSSGPGHDIKVDRTRRLLTVDIVYLSIKNKAAFKDVVYFL